MSILSALTKSKTFDSHSDIVELIKGLEQENVYLRRDRTESIASFVRISGATNPVRKKG